MPWPTWAPAAVLGLVLLLALALTLALRRQPAIPDSRRLEQWERALAEREMALHQQREALAGMTADEAQRMLLADAERRSQAHVRAVYAAAERGLRESLSERAAFLLVAAAGRMSLPLGPVLTTTIIPVPAALKSRVIGPKGVNMKTFTRLTGVELDLVDGPGGGAELTSFDPWRRQVAAVTLRELLAHGQIHAKSIEAAYRAALQQEDAACLAVAVEAAEAANVPDLPPEILRHMGRLRFRTIHGRDVLELAVYGAVAADLLARELGLTDTREVRVAAFLRDLGQALDHESPGGHAAAGAELAARFGLDAATCRAVSRHHDMPAHGWDLVSAVVAVTDGFVSSALGDRDHVERAFARLRDVENLCLTMPGVTEAHAVRMGSEVRVFVDAAAVADQDVPELAIVLSERLRDQLGVGREVVVIRETRASAMTGPDVTTSQAG